MAQILRFGDAPSFIKHSNNTGCLVDTNILFSLSYPLDKFNDESEKIFNIFSDSKIPVYTNINVRSEFIELHRRVVIPESLIDLLEDANDNLHPQVTLKLKSLRTQFRAAHENEKLFKLSDQKIKGFRKLLSQYRVNGVDMWLKFCSDYLVGRIQDTWRRTVDLWHLNYPPSMARNGEHPFFNEDLNWGNMVHLVEKFGLGASDAMILNFFKNSKLNMLVTADVDLIYCASKLKLPGKTIFVPDNLRL